MWRQVRNHIDQEPGDLFPRGANQDYSIVIEKLRPGLNILAARPYYEQSKHGQGGGTICISTVGLVIAKQLSKEFPVKLLVADRNAADLQRRFGWSNLSVDQIHRTENNSHVDALEMVFSDSESFFVRSARPRFVFISSLQCLSSTPARAAAQGDRPADLLKCIVAIDRMSRKIEGAVVLLSMLDNVLTTQKPSLENLRDLGSHASQVRELGINSLFVYNARAVAEDCG